MAESGANGKHWWQTLPGIFTGLAALVSALAGLLTVIKGGDWFKPSPQSQTITATALPPAAPATPASVAAPSPTAAAAAATAPAPAAAAAPVAAPLPAPTVARAADPTARQATIVDPDGFAYLRSSPGTEQAPLAKLPNGTQVSVLGRNGNWMRVRTGNGQIGFVHRSRLDRAGE